MIETGIETVRAVDVPKLPSSAIPGISANLDLLRAIAVLCVFFSHLVSSLGDRRYGSFGRFGVILFFLHTSFVLMGSLERLEPSAQSFSRLAMGFWIRRLFRIYPLAILFVLLAVAFHVPLFPGFQYAWFGAKTFLSNLALTQNLTYSKSFLSPMWSLPLEVQMYAMLPFVYFGLRGKMQYRSLLLWALAIVLGLTIPHISGRLNVFLYAPCFLSGAVAYDLCRTTRWRLRLPAWIWLAGIVLLLAVFGRDDITTTAFAMHRAWIWSLALGVLFANVKEGSWGMLKPVFHWIAEHSYGIYLSHIVIFWMVIDRMSAYPLWVRTLALIAGAIGIPALLYVWIEEPLILAGKRVANHLLRTDVAISG
jgi:peptidoglycan/LPS O-acetylase OafA/YrhL